MFSGGICGQLTNYDLNLTNSSLIIQITSNNSYTGIIGGIINGTGYVYVINVNVVNSSLVSSSNVTGLIAFVSGVESHFLNL